MESEKKKVMVAYDGSECSHYALQWTLKNLRHSISNSHIIIFTVLSLAEFTSLFAAPVDLITYLQENKKRFAAAILKKAKDMCADHGIVSETITEFGEAKETICEAVEKFNIQLLVLGSHSKVALERVILGSVSSYCVHKANCPVLVVRKAD